MAESNILTWTPANWVTVLLMTALGFFIVGMVVKIVKERKTAGA